MGDTDASHYHGCQALLLAVFGRLPVGKEAFFRGKNSTKKESYRILPQKFQNDLPVFPSWGLIGQPCSGRSEFFFLHRVLLDIRYCWWQFNATRWRGETWPKRCWFLFCLNVAIWRLKRSSPIFFQTWVESKQTDKLRPTCTLDGRKLVGFESQGMVLCATSKDGKVEPHG